MIFLIYFNVYQRQKLQSGSMILHYVRRHPGLPDKIQPFILC